MSEAVLDASAILAVINGEPGANIVVRALEDRALLSAVNYAEVMTKLVEQGMDRQLASTIVLNIGVQVIEFEIALAERTGELRPPTKPLGLSLADRACLALAEREGLPAFTADRSWSKANLGIDIRVIR